MKAEKIINVHITPTKQIARIVQGKKTLKRYKFKTVIPFTIEQRESYSHDYGEWCVSERDSVTMVNHKVFCSKTIKDLKSKIFKKKFKKTKETLMFTSAFAYFFIFFCFTTLITFFIVSRLIIF